MSSLLFLPYEMIVMHPGQTCFFLILFMTRLLMFFTSAVGKYRQSCSLGTCESVPLHRCRGMSSC